jgi:hypothetical protein
VQDEPRPVVLLAHALNEAPGGNDGAEDGRSGTFGNVQISPREDGRERTNAVTRFHPEIARPADRRPDQDRCEDRAPSAPQLLFTNLAVAAATLGTFHAWLTGTLDWEEVYLDIARGRMTPVAVLFSGRPSPGGAGGGPAGPRDFDRRCPGSIEPRDHGGAAPVSRRSHGSGEATPGAAWRRPPLDTARPKAVHSLTNNPG